MSEWHWLKYSRIEYSIYSGAKKYLVSHQLCKFSHLKRWERPLIFIIGTLQLWQTKWEKQIQKITFKWENLHNWWLTKYFFAPLYVSRFRKLGLRCAPLFHRNAIWTYTFFNQTTFFFAEMPSGTCKLSCAWITYLYAICKYEYNC